ncbi:CPBP family intramembrane glutamic endopeptidase [Crocosphaera chwakensis]|uniref:Abortive infection protein n=1 Tax=Crocosphaera chwakensis CCY0110 TaxID=391612 RepID=A3IXM4_9CHRO|nr:CPBP family intramembrane glutamic endopeptidase [Crocosphaera chwakensis]EAZ88780.1 Abortive infection protein [Crocosphaera chwakensis CCY0110]
MSLISIKNGLIIPADRSIWEVFVSSHLDPLLSSVKNFPSESKIGLFLLIWLLLWLPIALLMGKKLDWQPFQPLEAEKKIPLLIPLYLLVPWFGWSTLIVEGTSLTDYGLSLQWDLLISLCIGLLLGLGGLGIVFAIEGGLGWQKWHSENLNQLEKVVLPIFGLAMWIALTEEFVFRGIFQTILEEKYNPWVSAIIISSIFALLHLLWERQQTLPQLPGLWLMGIVLVIARWVDGGSLGLAWGLHAGWVWGLASLDAADMIAYTGKGKDWIIGMYQQPLGGMMGILCLLGTGLVLWFGL